jgi:hypothetical protein
MTKLTLEALESVGESTVTICVNTEIFMPEMVEACGRRCSGVSVSELSCVSIDGPDPQAHANLRAFCAELILAKLSSL